MSNYKENIHFIFKIEKYLCDRNLMNSGNIQLSFKNRNAGKAFEMSEHIKGMIYSLLSNQRSWSGIAIHLDEIDKIFYNYDMDCIINTNPTYFIDELKKIKCGNRAIKRQMNYLADNINIFKSIEKEYGSIDLFVTSELAYQIVDKLSDSKSKYKLYNMGKSLAWEYLRNVGIDGAKPDVHTRRFLGSLRMGRANHEIATVQEVYDTVLEISNATGLTMAEVDNRIWSYCAEGYGDVCGATPKCNMCPIKNECNFNNKLTDI